jgi:hypothetical protein
MALAGFASALSQILPGPLKEFFGDFSKVISDLLKPVNYTVNLSVDR